MTNQHRLAEELATGDVVGDSSNPPTSIEAARLAFGRDILGPVIASYLQKLWETCQYFEKEKSAKILFCARAGVRIRHALEIYMGRVGVEVPADWEMFWVSRLMIAKGIWQRCASQSRAVFNKEYGNINIDMAVDCIVGRKPSREAMDSAYRSTPLDFDNLDFSKSEKLSQVEEHLQIQSELFEQETRSLLCNHKSALLIDTGWMASSQRMLSKGMPDIDWWGAYFGLSSIEQESESRDHWARAIGLMFMADAVDPDSLETSIIECRHVIESLFEPLGPSIEQYRRDADGKISADGAKANLADRERCCEDSIFSGVLAALAAAPRDPAAVMADAQQAWRRLQQFLLTPTLDETKIFQAIERSADFGRGFTAKLLLPKDDRTSGARIAQALWTAGQIALENEEGMAGAIMRKRFGLSRGPLHELATPQVVLEQQPRVAVITRTMDRPMLLRRALTSVHMQTFRDYIHVVVSDGGDIRLVREAIAEANIDHSKVLLVDNIENRGMEAASNIAIAASKSEYVVIHDDDDTWHPDFLKQTVEFLASESGQHYGGVITKSVHVSEEILAEGIKIHGLRPYRPDLAPPTLQQMMELNTFAPISFVFRRECYDKVGPYREDYPVLGDWEFNIRFLEEFDIALIDDYLAYYHHRDVGDSSTFGNSIIAGRSDHFNQVSIMRNELLRRSIRAGKCIAEGIFEQPDS